MSVVKFGTSQNRLTSSGASKLHRSSWRESSIPTKEECEALWARFGVSEEVAVHSRMVSELARILAIYLNQTGSALNLDLIVACGYLHELANGKPDPARTRAKISYTTNRRAGKASWRPLSV